MLASLRSHCTLSSARSIAGVAIVCFALAACRSQHAASPAAASSAKTDAPVIDTAGSSPDANMASLEAAVSPDAPSSPNAPAPAPAATPDSSSEDKGLIRYVTVQDPALGMPEGDLPVFASWHGSLTVDHSTGTPYNDVNLASADGAESVHQFGVPFVTLSPQAMNTSIRNVIMYRRAVPGRYQSASQILLQYVVPSLRLGGQPGEPQRGNEQAVATIKNKIAARGISGMQVGSARVRISGISQGGDAVVTSLTTCISCGTTVESTSTTYAVFRAPAAKLDPLVAAWFGLPPVKVNPAWQEAVQRQGNQQVQASQAGADRSAASAAAARSQAIEAISTSQQAIAAGHARTNAQINQMHQDTQAGINARNNFDQDQQNRATQNAGRLSTGVINGQGSAHRWCKGNSSVFVWDRTTSPDGTAGWYQCDNP